MPAPTVTPGRIRHARCGRGMSQIDLSTAIRQAAEGTLPEKLLISPRVSDWERGKMAVPEEVLPYLCEILGLNPPTAATVHAQAPAARVVATVAGRTATYADVR